MSVCLSRDFYVYLLSRQIKVLEATSGSVWTVWPHSVSPWADQPGEWWLQRFVSSQHIAEIQPYQPGLRKKKKNTLECLCIFMIKRLVYTLYHINLSCQLNTAASESTCQHIILLILLQILLGSKNNNN